MKNARLAARQAPSAFILYKHCSYCLALRPVCDLQHGALSGELLCSSCFYASDNVSGKNSPVRVGKSLMDWGTSALLPVSECGYDLTHEELIFL